MILLQTSPVKNWIKNLIVETVNKEINGNISIGKLDGTFFTSIQLENLLLTTNNGDTVAYFKYLSIKTSPLKLLSKEIYIRQILINQITLNLVEESDGELNITKIYPVSEEPEDTSETKFPFIISVENLEIKNLNFNLQSYENNNSKRIYKVLNTEDLRISNFELLLSAKVDINKPEFNIEISNLKFKPNLENFELAELSGKFFISDSSVAVSDLSIKTNYSQFSVSSEIVSLDLINKFSIEYLETSPLKLSLKMDNFNFIDLSSFVEETDFLTGDISGELEVTGSLENLNISKLNLTFQETNIMGYAQIQKTLDGSDMIINANLDKSILNLIDLNKLLSDVRIPNYDLGVIKFDKIRFSGKPTNFKSELSMVSKSGNLNLLTSFNFNSPNPIYDVLIYSNNLNLFPLIGQTTNLNSEIKVKGEGFEIEKMTSKQSILLNNSKFENLEILSMNFSSQINDKILNFSLELESDTTDVSLNGKIDFLRPNDPYFDINGSIKEINIASIIGDSSLSSNLNFNFDIEGKGKDIDSMNLFAVVDITDSYLSNIQIDSTRIILDVRRNDNGNKVLNLISNLIDFTVIGNYKLSSLVKTLGYQSELLTQEIQKKFSAPLDLELKPTEENIQSTAQIKGQKFEAKLLLDFKEFVPLKFDYKNSIEIGGEIRGNLVSDEENLNLKLNANLNYLKFLSDNNLFFLTHTLLDFSLKKINLQHQQFDTEIRTKITSDRIYFGNSIYNFNSEILFYNDSIKFESKGFYEDYLSFDFTFLSNIENEFINIDFSNVNFLFKGIPISNYENLNIAYSKNDILINKFQIKVSEGLLTAKGKFGNSHDGLLEFKFSDIKGSSILKRLLDLPANAELSSNIDLQGSLAGNFDNPKLNLNYNSNELKINERILGDIISNINYSEDNLFINFKLIEKISDKSFERLVAEGNIPLSNKSKNDTIKTDNEINLKIISDDLNLKGFDNLIPDVSINDGFLESEVYIKGTLTRPYVIGYLNLNEISLTPAFNNLVYFVSSKIFWDDEIINIEELSISNSDDIKNGGYIKGNGIIKLTNLLPDSILIKLNGNIKLLDQITKEVNPIIYGDLTVSSPSDIIFSLNKNELNLKLPINITKADVILPLSKTAYAKTSDIIYRYATDFNKSEVESELEKLIEEFEKRKRTQIEEINGSKQFNYDISISTANDAKVTVILSKELNQDLVALLSGNINLSSKEGISRTSGQFNLLEGSKLSFIKTFEARGNIRLEKFDNPLLDITATYRDYYYPVSESGTSTEEEVAIKIKLKGPLSELNKNFVKDPENIGVYIGAENILKDQRDETKTPTDALFFIIAGKFTDGATTQERNAVASTAASFAGSIIGNVLNQYVGDYVRSVQLRQFGDQTKFSLIGKVGNFKYEIGGTTEIFQDLSRANVKIELPIQQRLFMRLERKESFSEQSTLNANLYNELGIKYKFEF
jgi:hypothetical protein